MGAQEIALLIALVRNGAGWLAHEIALARQEGRITDEQFRALLDEAKASDRRFDQHFQRVLSRVGGDNAARGQD